MPQILARVVTLAYLAITQVFFRADNMHQGFEMFKGLTGLHGVLLPESVKRIVATLCHIDLPMGHIFVDFPYEIFVPAVCLTFFVASSTKLVKKTKPSTTLAILMVITFLYTASRLGETTDFLYFQF